MEHPNSWRQVAAGAGLRRRTSRRVAGWRAVAAVAVCGAALAGCDAKLQTAMTVTDSAVSMTVSFDATGELASEMAKPANTESLAKIAADKLGAAGGALQVSAEAGRFHAETAVDYTKAVQASGVTGVASASLTRTSDSEAVLDVECADPSQLRDAIAAGVAGQPDAVALADTMAAGLWVQVRVGFAGGISGAEFRTGDKVVTVPADGDQAVWSLPLAQFQKGTLVVRGDPRPAPWTAKLRWPVTAAVAAGLTVVALTWAVRRDRRRQAQDVTGTPESVGQTHQSC